MVLTISEYSDRMHAVAEGARRIGIDYGTASIEYNRRLREMGNVLDRAISRQVYLEAIRTGRDIQLPLEVEEAFREFILPIEKEIEEKAGSAPVSRKMAEF